MPTTKSLLTRSLFVGLLCVPALAWGTDEEMGLYLDPGQMVETAGHYPQPVSQVAENVTVITADEIEKLHAHTLGEVLSRIPALFVTGNGWDFGSFDHLLTQGAAESHTLVLIDGVRYNNASVGEPFTNGLPLGIIKRIEVMKGPASSAWGSSLAGVVNIITKETGSTARPTGQVNVSVGERSTNDANAQVAGAAGPLGYFLFAGNQETDGHFRDYWFDNQPVYAKLSLPLAKVTMGASIGHSAPHYKVIESPGDGDYGLGGDVSEYHLNRSTFGTAYLDAALSQRLNLHLALSRFDQTFDRENDSLGLGTTVIHTWALGERLDNSRWEETNTAASARLTWTGHTHSAALGFESGRGDLDFTGDWPYWAEWGFPAVPYNGQEERRAAYAQAALTWGRLTLTPGTRYDFNSVSGDFVSPSLGAVWRLTADTLLRASASRGFNAPHLALLYDTLGGNPDLEPEKVNSVQAGVETVAVPGVKFVASVFHHRVSDRIGYDDNGINANLGKSSRRGFELAADTLSWHRLRFGAKTSAVYTDSADQDNDAMYAANLTARYDHPEMVSVRLDGRYIWWDSLNRRDDAWGNKFDDFIWDLSVSRELYRSEALRAEAFVMGRNIFNGSQYWVYDYHNPGRWLETGLSVKF